MLNYLWFLLAALFEIAGCYAFWLWLRLDRSPWWIAPGLASLVLFALLLTRIEAAYAGRAYAAYGGIYVVASLGWLALVPKERPTLKAVTAWLTAHLSIMFVPAAVGLIDEGAPLSRYGVGILAATAVSTLLTMVVTALVFRWAVKRFGPPEPQPEAVEEAAS